ncbi:MAG: dienelactone hydrolase family protein [Microbacteriaceae bacterium]
MTNRVPIPSPGAPLHFGEPGAPVVVVLHDWYGRLPWLAPYAEALASRGFRVVVPDLYGGVCTVDAATAKQLMEELDVKTALEIVDEVVDLERATRSTKVGLVGLSLGGWLALLHAQAGTPDVVVSYYSTLGEADHGLIPSPVLLHFAETDDWDPGADEASFIGRLTEHGTPVTHHTYTDTVHGFANASVTATANTRAAALAFARTVMFLEKHLID